VNARNISAFKTSFRKNKSNSGKFPASNTSTPYRNDYCTDFGVCYSLGVFYVYYTFIYS
jgi:hypothetical protein